MHTYRDADQTMLEAVFSWGKEIIANRGKIVFFSEYTNAPNEITAIFETDADEEGWKVRLKKAHPDISI